MYNVYHDMKVLLCSFVNPASISYLVSSVPDSTHLSIRGGNHTLLPDLLPAISPLIYSLCAYAGISLYNYTLHRALHLCLFDVTDVLSLLDLWCLILCLKFVAAVQCQAAVSNQDRRQWQNNQEEARAGQMDEMDDTWSAWKDRRQKPFFVF